MKTGEWIQQKRKGKNAAGSGDGMPVDYSVYRLSARETVLFWGLWIGGSAVIGDLFYDSPAAGLALFVAAWPARKGYSAVLAEKRRAQLAFQFRDLLYSLSSAAAAGRPLGGALLEAEADLSLIYEADAPIMTELRAMGRQIRDGQSSGTAVLRELGLRSGIRDIRSFAEVCTICRSTGGDLEYAVTRAAGILMDKIDLRREAEALTAQKRLETTILAVLPFALLFFLKLVSPDYLEPLYSSAAGRGVMTFCLLLMAAALLWCLRLLKGKGGELRE